MSEIYKGKAQDRVYTGEQVDIRYNLKRCIHAEECVKHLSAVFDPKRKPWILPNEADSAEDVAQVLQLCPSGALHYERKDGGEAEPIPTENRVILWQNGPLQVIGDLSIQGANVQIEDETRVTLCRCGASQNKPFCDNSHKQIDFVAETTLEISEETLDGNAKLTITAGQNGSFKFEGNFRIEDETGRTLFRGSKTWLCRCGHSKRKPFCDGSHKAVGFEAE